MTVIDRFFSALAAELSSLGQRRLMSRQSFLSGKSNACSWLHARVLGAMARAVPTPYCPMLEVKWSRRFVPDLCIVGPGENIEAVVEYESTNSSDERIVLKDLAHFEEAMVWCEDHPEPGNWVQHWILVSTLPDCAVKHWPWWSYNERIDCPPRQKDRAARDASPFSYYVEHLHKSFASTWRAVCSEAPNGTPHSSLIWANIDHRSIAILNVDGERIDRPRRIALAI